MENNKNTIFIKLLPLKTKRLIIRSTTIKDVDMLLKMDKQEITQRYLGGIKNKTKEERREFLKDKENKFKEGYISSLTVCLKDNTPIGFLGLKLKDNLSANISYIFDYDYCNKGYCTEACQKIIEICFHQLMLKNIYADTLENNNSSKRVLEKLDFKFQEKFRKNSLTFCLYKRCL